MMVNHWRGLLLVLGFILVLPVLGQDAADRNLFEQTKARADKGDAQAQFDLAALYTAGTGVRADPAKAVKWLRKAAEQGLARAQYELGLDYVNGVGVKSDKAEAARWFRRAAEQDMPEAQVMLGSSYATGEGARQNSVEALTWYRKAAEQGLGQGQYEVGMCYFQGRGVAKDIVEAIRWIQQAAETGFPPAQNTLAQCYEKGTGVPKDAVQAYKWYSLAAAHDDDLAADVRVSLGKVEAGLTPDQVAEAQRLAGEFKPGVKSEPTQGHPATGSKAGTVNVKAEDESAEIFVDNAFVGNPPAKLTLAEGLHVIAVKKTGFKEFRREISVTPGSDLTLRAVLERE